MRVKRFVIDTNVLISAALSRNGTPRRVIEYVGSTNGVVLFSRETFDELRTRLLRSKFDRYVEREGRVIYLEQLAAISQWVSVSGAVLGCRDPEDDKILETALLGAADCLVTGDKDLLVMSPFDGILIQSPADFLANQV